MDQADLGIFSITCSSAHSVFLRLSANSRVNNQAAVTRRQGHHWVQVQRCITAAVISAGKSSGRLAWSSGAIYLAVLLVIGVPYLKFYLG